MTRRLTAAVLGALLLALGLGGGTGAAAASTAAGARAGGFTSYITGANNGFASRTWTDLNDDNTDGLIQFRGCTSNPRVGIQNVSTGRIVVEEIMWCLNTTDDFWHGRLPRGDYRFVILDKRGPNPLNVDFVYVRYQTGTIA
ncbi:hypothetical protein AB0K12_41445 [Nonomuraea sp. NPDC049419]|uniref:hypothetical protein n=1 Tax=Nonomuraea sp. NPDC049419 TaxID=3155772 RepID=UPI003418F33B